MSYFNLIYTCLILLYNKFHFARVFSPNTNSTKKSSHFHCYTQCLPGCAFVFLFIQSQCVKWFEKTNQEWEVYSLNFLETLNVLYPPYVIVLGTIGQIAFEMLVKWKNITNFKILIVS